MFYFQTAQKCVQIIIDAIHRCFKYDYYSEIFYVRIATKHSQLLTK